MQQQVKGNLAIIVPLDYSNEAQNFNGGAKDIQSMLEQISELGISHEVFRVPRKALHALHSLLREQVNIFSASHILLSIPGSSGLLFLYLRFLGFSNLVFRSHNAEFLHRWEWVKCSKSIVSIFKSFKKMLFGYSSDFIVSIFSTKILSISEKEIEVYWKVFFPWSQKKLNFFPSSSPSHIIELSKYSLLQKDKDRPRPYATIVGGFHSGTAISMADTNFVKNGFEIRKHFQTLGLRLVSVGHNTEFEFCDTNFGYVANLMEVLSDTEVVLIPTVKGWGFKTKIGDAVTLHQSIVVTQPLYDRLGIWRRMVSPLRDWSDISLLELKTISLEDYDDFVLYVRHLRDKILKQIM